jgi:hypothetical protein
LFYKDKWCRWFQKIRKNVQLVVAFGKELCLPWELVLWYEEPWHMHEALPRKLQIILINLEGLKGK